MQPLSKGLVINIYLRRLNYIKLLGPTSFIKAAEVCFCLFPLKKTKHPAPPQMAVNFNFLPKSTFYTAFPCTFVFPTKTKIKEKEKMHKGADEGDMLHINCRGKR